MRDVQMEKLAAQYYNPELPYHNFGHITRALDAADDILDRCHERGIAIDETAVYYAILFHDAGYHEDHIAKGFGHKEDYSAQIATVALERKKLSGSTLEKITLAIRATRQDFDHAATPEIQAVRAADLCQLAADFPVFRTNTVNLWREYEMISGKRMPWDQWKTRAVAGVEYFLDNGLFEEPGAAATEIESFLAKARSNLTILKTDPH